ncbi:uncharacterized protein LOC115447287 isoform X2 [Manduca sexta]|uniref:uncharacterized protein LOC115447287 isoform X2 n=1 Tax=Manduca sexta TaxID=7130 RepID=UPI0011843B7A|nr:uncharacterized protein LOC115447287 isoform X2 [Manduca sexta]
MLDPPPSQTPYPMENKKTAPATQQPLTQQHVMAHHVHPDQIYTQQHPQMSTHLTSTQTGQIQPNGVMHQLLQSQYHSNMNARSPLLENRHELYGTGHNHDYARYYGANDNYNYPQSPPRIERTEVHTDHNVNHELFHNVPKGYNAEVYQDYLKRNPPKETNQIYQNHQPLYRPNVNQYGSKPYLPYSNRIGPQSNTELLRRQYTEIQQMKLQQQLHYQSQAQMHQQQKFAERQLLLQQIHGVQPPANLQNSIYSDGSYRDFDRYSSKNDFKDYASPDTSEERYGKNMDYKEMDRQNRQYQESQWQLNQQMDYRDHDSHGRSMEGDKGKSQSPPSDYHNQVQKNNTNVMSPMKSSESSTPSVKSPSTDSRRSSGGNQALRSPTAQRIPSAPVAMSGILYKQGSDGLKVWRKRWFVLSEYCLFYYKSQDEEKLLGSVLLPSYKVSACSNEDKVLRKFSFKLEHANMRTYILAAPDQESMTKWVKALTMAALMQTPSDPPQKHGDRAAAKTEDGEEIPMYANAPPKPRRSNEGYNSPSPDMYDPNYDLLKKPTLHYSQGTSQNRYSEHSNYPNNPNQESTYTRSPQSPPPQQHHQYPKRSYDTHNLSLPLTNTINDRIDNQPSTSSMHKSDPQSPCFDRSRKQHEQTQENKQDQIYERQPQRNPFLQDVTPQIENPPKEQNVQNKTSRSDMEQERTHSVHNESYNEPQSVPKPMDAAYNRDVYGELNPRIVRANSAANERLLIERRTPDAYGRSTAMSSYNKEKIGDYEDVYGSCGTENEYGKTYAKSPNPSQTRDNVSISSHQHQISQQSAAGNYPQEKTFSGPSVLRRKKMQASGIQPPMPRPHSADFLEYEQRNEMHNKSMPARAALDPPRQPQRPKSSLDINSYYDPSSDRYYSEESYAEKMRQSAQYLQQGLGPRNMDIPLAKYASGLAQKQLSSAYSQITNNNYETEFSTNRANRDNVSYNSKSDIEGLNSNWTLKEKAIGSQKDYLTRSGSVMSDGSNVSGYIKEASRYDLNPDGFMRSASARLPSTNEKEGEKKVQQREESMKRLLEWKQRMLQSPLTRKSTPATISLARSLNHSRQSLRSDQYKAKTYTNASYNSYSSDDEEETSGTDLQNPKDMQAGRSHNVNLTSPNIMRPITSHASCAQVDDSNETNVKEEGANNQFIENTYENIFCTISVPKVNLDDDNDYEETISNHENLEDVGHLNDSMIGDGYETHESEAESETQLEYTDNDLDEVLLESDHDVSSSGRDCDSTLVNKNNGSQTPEIHVEGPNNKPSTPPVFIPGENHYLPMSPRKTSMIELPHQSILQDIINIHDKPHTHIHEDNPYVEMNMNNEESDAQTYEIVCVNDSKPEPVYMELTNVISEVKAETMNGNFRLSLDTASNFADTKELTLRRGPKNDKMIKEKYDCSDADDEASKDMSLDTPFSRFSISDTFRPASYYLSGSSNVIDIQDSSDSEIFPPPPVPSSPPPCENLSDEALSKYILDKLDKSDMAHDNSILKMLTSENQKMNTVRRKATSLMIYGSPTSIHDTLSRGEKIRNSRASLPNERNKANETPISLNNTTVDNYKHSVSIETDSLRSYNADRGSSRLSLESDVSSKFDMAPSNISSEVTSLNDSDLAIDFRHPSGYRDLEMMIKRRPLSDDSLFELADNEFPVPKDISMNVDLDKYLDNLQPSTSDKNSVPDSLLSTTDVPCNNEIRVSPALPAPHHVRSSSTPVNHTTVTTDHGNRHSIGTPFKHISEQTASYGASKILCNSIGVSKSPISYYCKNYDEEKLLTKNLNRDNFADKIKEFENDKIPLRSQNETNTSSTSTGFHSRESSTEHSAPYYYSDLSSQEHINVLPTSHYLKNTNLHRKLNNQRRRGPIHKKSEICHIHNPIRSTQPFDLAATAKSVSVEFLSAADKDPEIDMKNIYESTGGRNSKISESMSLISGLGSKRNSSNNSNMESLSSDCNAINNSSLTKLSSTSMSSHCSGNSSTTVYYDAEAEAHAYENVICQGEKHWDEDSLWRDNLRRVSHRHARSLDDLDTVPADSPSTNRLNANSNVMNSIKRVKKDHPPKSKNVTYVNYEFQARGQRRRENGSLQNNLSEKDLKIDENDVYVSLAENAEIYLQQSDEGVYEQLAIESSNSTVVMQPLESKCGKLPQNKKKFEIDREKLRQWDLMSSGLIKDRAGCVRGAGACAVVGDVACDMDPGTDSASNEGI